MALDQLVGQVSSAQVVRGGEVRVQGLCSDSRKVQGMELFACLKGGRDQGLRYLDEALARGAAAVLAEEDPGPRAKAWVRSPDPRSCLSDLACAFYGDPTQALSVIAVTGTHGKTTICRLLASVLGTWGRPAAVLGTLGGEFGPLNEAFDNTTPPAWEIQAFASKAREQGAQALVMEASSDGLAQGRLRGVKVSGALFTNLTRDHLNTHKTFEAYRQAKSILFSSLVDAGGFTLANADDPESRQVVSESRAAVHWYGMGGDKEFHPEDPVCDSQGVRFTQGGDEFSSPLLGGFNLSNLLAVVGAGRLLGIPASDIARGLESAPVVPGRMEPVDAGQDFLVLVDYAHTPDALENVLKAVRPLARNKVLVLFGCGGDRDRGKRPDMGRVAGRHGHRVMVTSDNPRSEDPLSIIQDILAGLEGAPCHVEVQPDRAMAIRAILGQAKPGDVVVIAGKGHEDYQLVGGMKHHFDDREEARKALSQTVGRA